MALLFCEGFEGYGTTAGTNFDGDFFSNKWITENAGNTQIGDGRDGGQSLRVHSASLAARFEPQGTTVLDGEFVLGFAFRYTALTNICVMAAFRLNTSVRTNLLLNLDGTISIRRNTTVLATGATALVSGQWYYIELKTKCRDVGSYELKIDGVTELSDASEDMNPGGADGFNNLRFTANTGTTIEFDDLYLLDTTGSVNNDFLGDSKVTLLFADGAGSSTAWTPDSGSNFARVNEAAPDGNTSYVESSSGDDLYTFGDASLGGSVHAVQVDIHAITASSSMSLLAKSGSTTGAGSTHSLTASYAAYRSIFETNPDTSSPWSQSEVNAAEFGLRRVSGTPRVTRVAVAVLQAAEDPFTVFGESTVTLTSEAVSEANFITADAESTLALDDDVDLTVDGRKTASDTLNVQQTLGLSITVAPIATSALSLVSAGIGNRETDADAASTLVISGDTSIGIEHKPVVSALSSLDMEATAVLAKNVVHALTLTQSASVPWGAHDILVLSQEAVFVPPSATRFAESELELTQEALTLKILGLSVVSTLDLQQGLAAIVPDRSCDWADIDQPGGTLTQGIRLLGSTSSVDISRSMNLGDIDRMAFDRIMRETRGGTLHVFADPIWPKTETLVFTLSAVKRSKAMEVLTFMRAYLGKEIMLETHEGRQWLGFVLNPGEAVIEDHPNSFTISIEFEGELLVPDPAQAAYEHGLYLGERLEI